MVFWRRSRRPERLLNISVYYLSAIVDGIAKSKPLGIIPRVQDVYEADIKKRHVPAGNTYINEEFGGKPVILLWNNSSIEATSFLTAKDAESCAGFKPFAPDDLVKLDPVLVHFPR